MQLSNIKNLYFALYTLKFKASPKTRLGALLKVQWLSQTGYADLHPYPEKGEEDLKFHLKALKEKHFTCLSIRALCIAFESARARAKGRNLLSSLNFPLSHYLILDVENFSPASLEKKLAQGFKVFKVKLGPPLKKQSEKLLKLIKAGGGSVKWRLDFHTNLSRRKWQEWEKEYISKIPLKSLDFIEAPFDYEERLWSKSLALDVWGRENTLPVSVLVWKSARKALPELLKKQAKNLFKRVVFTHSLSHPLDQVASAYFAARFYKVAPRFKEVCGLTQDIYENHDFTLPDQGPVFPKLSGIGFGFDSNLWDQMSWKKLF